MKHSSKILARAALGLLTVIVFAGPAHAHKVNIFAYAEDGWVHTESYFADGGSCAGCVVKVEDTGGKVLVEGVTDVEGAFAFEIPAAEDLRVIIIAGTGHRNDYVIKAAEIKAAMPEEQGPESGKPGKAKPGAGDMGQVKHGAANNRPVKQRPGNKAAETAGKVPAGQTAGKPGSAAPLTAGDIRAVVDETVEARLKPVYGMLADIRKASEKPRLSEVIGGIGYIMGIMGVILYFKSRRA